MPGKPVHFFLIVAAALVPLAGVLAGGWSLREVVVLYWAENVVIGLIHLVRMVTVSPPGIQPGGHIAKLGAAGFFGFHYGFFCFVHGIFVFALTGGAFVGGGSGPGGGPSHMIPSLREFPAAFWVALGLIGANHLWALVERWFLNGRWKSARVGELMAEPYKHIIVLHVGIVLGAFLSLALGNPIGVLVIIVIGKFLIDLREVLRGGSADRAGHASRSGPGPHLPGR